MKFTKLEIVDPLKKVVESALPLYRKAPENQKAGIRIQVSSRMAEIIKAQGKIYLEEEKAYVEAVNKTVKDMKLALGKSVADMKDLQKLKHKPKNEKDIKGLHLRVDQSYAMGVALVGEMSKWGEGLTAHQGWRGDVIPGDKDAKELLGDAEIKQLDATFKKIREMGVGLISSVKSPKAQADEMLKRLETLSKAAALAAKDLLGASEVENFAKGELDELEKPNSGDIAVVEQLVGSMPGALDGAAKSLKDFLKDKKKITAKTLEAAQTFHNRNVVTRGGHIKEAQARNETIKTTCAEIEKAAKKGGKGAVSPETLKRMTDALAKAKVNDKILAKLTKDFGAYEKSVTKDLAKLKA